MDDVVLNKAAVIQRCLQRVGEIHAGDDRNLIDDQTRQDAIVLNLLRACEATIDLAMHLVRIHRIGVPQDSREAFDLLASAKLLDTDQAEILKRMVGFRNVAVHDYTRLDLAIVRAIVVRHVADLDRFAAESIRRHSGG